MGGTPRVRQMPHEWPVHWQYALAIGLMGLSLVARWLLDGVLNGHIPYALSLGVLLPLVLLVNPGPFVAAAVLGWLGAMYLFVPPPFSFRITTLQEAVIASLYGGVLLLGFVAASLSHRRRQVSERNVLELTPKFRSVFNQSGIFAGITDLDGTVREVNDLALSACGYRAEEVVGLPFWDTPWWRGSEGTRVAIREGTLCAARGDVYRATLPYWLADGTERVVDVAIHPIRDDAGRVMWLHPTGIDMTERVRAEAQIRHRGEQFQTLVDRAPLGVLLVDADFRLVRINPAGMPVFSGIGDVTGRRVDEVLRELWPAGGAHDLVGAFRLALDTGESYHVPELKRVRAGRETPEYYDWRADRITLPDGRAGVVSYFRDVSEEVAARLRLAESEQRLRIAASAAQLGLHDYDVTAGTITWDERTRELWGIEPDESVSYDLWRRSLHPEDREPAARAVSRALDPAGDGRYLDQYRVRRGDGALRWIEATGRVTFAGGQPVRLVGTVEDITERRQAEETIRFHARLLEAVGQAVIVTDPEGVIIYWNHAAEDLYGWSRAEALGRPVVQTTVPATAPSAASADGILERIRRGEAWSGEFEVRCKDGSTRMALVTNTPMLDGDGRLKAIIGISVDISELKRIQQTLRDVDRRKDEFLATLAHELRNPLAAIRMALGVLNIGGNDPARLAAMTAIIERQSAQLVRLIDDLLDVSRITHGKVELRRAPVSLSQMVEHAVDGIAAECERKGVRLSVELPSEPVVVEADALRFAQVVSNLLSNACRFTDRGGTIVVSAARDGDAAVVRVRDTGAGIPREDLGRVFEMFTQVDGSPRGGGGLGIGLSLAQSLAAMHGGAIEAHSEGPGRGSEFVVRIPALSRDVDALQDVHPVAREAPDPAATGLVLAVDDNGDSLQAVAMSLRMAGYTVETAADGPEAVEKAQALHPRAVLLDIGLPGLDGYEVARRIRREPWGQDVLIVAMTGWGQERDKQQAREAGFDAHLTKPVDLADLVRVLVDREDRGGDFVPPLPIG